MSQTDTAALQKAHSAKMHLARIAKAVTHFHKTLGDHHEKHMKKNKIH